MGQVSNIEHTARSDVVCYIIGGYNSKAWLDGKPNTGIYVADKSRTLDSINCGYPACNQGGVLVIEIYQS